MNSDIIIRKASVKDIDDIIRLRRLMFISMGFTDENDLKKSDDLNKQYLEENIPSNHYKGWVAVKNGKIIGTGGIIIDQHPPSPFNFSGRIAYIMNIVVDEIFRRQGVARRIMKIIIKHLKEENIVLAELHATSMGRPLYEELGFKETNAMRLRL